MEINNIVERPWGKYITLEEGERFKIKKIIIDSGKRISLQIHHHRSEHWVVVSGTAKITRDGETLMINPNESVYIPATMKHRLENPGKIPLVIIEVQLGDYVGEDDIVRFDDDYNR